MKMNCDQVQPNLLEYGKGLVNGPEAEEIKIHIEHCKECADLLEEELAFSEHLACIPQEEPQHDVWALICEQTEPKRNNAFSWLRDLIAFNMRKATAAAVALAVLFAILYNFMPQQQSNQVVANSHQISTTPVKWSDDPVGQHADAMLYSIDNM